MFTLTFFKLIHRYFSTNQRVFCLERRSVRLSSIYPIAFKNYLVGIVDCMFHLFKQILLEVKLKLFKLVDAMMYIFRGDQFC
jgi:hypothetical protein